MTDDPTVPAERDDEPSPRVTRRTAPYGGASPVVPCPACHHARTHHPDCELASLPVAEAALLGHEEALRRVRTPRDDGSRVTGAPPPGAQCPACHHDVTHHPGCELAALSVEVAAALGYEEARHRVWLLDGVVSWGAPPPAPQCPGCHHSGDHGPGCDLAALPVGDAALLGYQAALRRVLELRGSRPPAVGAGEPVCPACLQEGRHRGGCELEALPVVTAAQLGHEEARARVRNLTGTPAPGPEAPAPGPEAPAPGPEAPARPAPPPSGGIRARLRRLLRR
ncbi:hypothetical protein [Streptomyces abyssomicinicus]|uniref:hypothetical protein n=1 Tax=Streptomyces abyssomicinicus TaxID=574929 RepID=UPI0012505BD9|nr:hypothetical protein [Streptomyces abyssomicinicus]